MCAVVLNIGASSKIWQEKQQYILRKQQLFVRDRTLH